MKSHGSSVGIATGYDLAGRSSGIRFPAGTGNLSLLHSVQTGSVAHLPSSPMGMGGALYPGVKRGRESDHSLPSRSEVKNAWRYTSTFQYVFMA
jgi:hypothetical protein